MARKEPIEVRPQRELDRFNDPIGPVPDWRTVPGATVVPRSSQDYEQRGQIIIGGFMIALNAPVKDSEGEAVVLQATDEFRVRGEVYQVEGQIGDYGRKIIFYIERPN